MSKSVKSNVRPRMVCNNLAWKVRECLRAKGATQQDLADAVGVSRVTISKYCSDHSLTQLNLNMELVNKIGKYFKLSPDYLIKSSYSVDDAYIEVSKTFSSTNTGKAFEPQDLPSMRSKPTSTGHQIKYQNKGVQVAPGEMVFLGKTTAIAEGVATLDEGFMTTIPQSETQAADFWAAAKYYIKKEYPQSAECFGGAYTFNRLTENFDYLDQANRIMLRFITLPTRKWAEETGSDELPVVSKMIRAAVGEVLYGEQIYGKRLAKYIFMYDMQADLEGVDTVPRTDCLIDWERRMKIQIYPISSHKELAMHFQQVYAKQKIHA